MRKESKKERLLKIREALLRANELSLSTYNIDIYEGHITRRAGGSLDYAIELVDELLQEEDRDERWRA